MKKCSVMYYRVTFLIFLLLGIVGCGSSSSGGVTTTVETGARLIAGDFSITETSGANTCSDPVGVVELPYTATISQTGSALTVVIGGDTFIGSIDGNNVSWTGSYAEDGGTATITNLGLSFSADGTSISGTVSWTWTDGVISCSGSTSVSGVKDITLSSTDSDATVDPVSIDIGDPVVWCCEYTQPIPSVNEQQNPGTHQREWGFKVQRASGVNGSIPDTHIVWSFMVEGSTDIIIDKGREGNITKLFTEFVDWTLTVIDPDTLAETVLTGTVDADLVAVPGGGVTFDLDFCVEDYDPDACTLLGDTSISGANADSSFNASSPTCASLGYDTVHSLVGLFPPTSTSGTCTYTF